ncbi:23S rRNA (guanosine(2251)-2'-O)-methyltransferase RlmB [Alkalicella caledoniensis]|uniref:23S rRNA (Guanosine(2251)-2'-O)-methyltransferase RlmB n=1 Tax=Alkalicella caledoniensis TaxID=2731377 RepID=A0A7G9W7Z7_ALKCA|nr:23S rRNA (guanosine(2251)-2'-O)-methyltransferase RlmB [Alkalicella caledoniensis]QNO14809.1 23S rRNA (guanosine(2251)-2'-O)-methyltransferase RlmB [Alkalicella caledoniensis]
MKEDIVYGKNSVKELLQSERPINKIHIQKGFKEQKIVDLAKNADILIKWCDKTLLDKITENGNHQGIAAMVSPKAYTDIDVILKNIEEKGQEGFLVILDSLEDPHNLGSIIRTGDGAGVDGIIIPKHRAVPLTFTVAKVAAGALEHVPVAQVTNLSQTIELLKAKGYWIFGADMDGTEYYKADLKGKICLVIGGEGKGIGQLVKKHCDVILSIPLKGEVSSLNAGVAAGILMYEVVKQRNS